MKCRECELASDVFKGAEGSPKLCKIAGFVYAAEHTCHIDDEEREEMLKEEGVA